MDSPFQLPANVNTSSSPTVVSFDNANIMFYKGSNDQFIYMIRCNGSLSGGEWTGMVPLPATINTSDAPAAIVVGNLVYVFYKGANDDGKIYVLRSQDLIAWETTVFSLQVNTNTRPEPYSSDALYVLYKGVDPDERIYVAALPADAAWQSV